ncbi:hypothetical protein V1524DRAFT_457441 [Lipomyces starkeyi]
MYYHIANTTLHIGYYNLSTMEPEFISVATLVSTTLTIGSHSLSMLDMAYRQVSPIVEMKLVGVFSNPAHGWDHITTALEPYGTILQTEFPRVGHSAIHEDALEITLALNANRILPPRNLPLVSRAPHFFKFSSYVRIRYVSEAWCIYCRHAGLRPVRKLAFEGRPITPATVPPSPPSKLPSACATPRFAEFGWLSDECCYRVWDASQRVP